MESSMDSSSPSHLMSTPVASKRMRRDDRVNPFEKHLLDRLHQPIWSPSVLSSGADATMETPPQTSWGIHHMSILNPIRIEESPSTHQNETILDPQSEADAQAKIQKFFSASEPIAPSPIVSMSRTNEKSTNTDLSFPAILPVDFEHFLYSYNSFNSRSEDMNTSFMRGRKLDFTIESDCESDNGGGINLDIENSNGKTFNSPCEEASGEKRNNVFIRSEDFAVDMISPMGTPIK